MSSDPAYYSITRMYSSVWHTSHLSALVCGHRRCSMEVCASRKGPTRVDRVGDVEGNRFAYMTKYSVAEQRQTTGEFATCQQARQFRDG
jgi:hypothetical protein